MIEFRYERPPDVDAAIRLAAAGHAKYLGGGTNLVDLMRENIERPDMLVDVSELSTDITVGTDGSLLLGAGARNTALAAHREVRARFPLLAQAVLSGASGQIRNMATVGGNLMQRTRCTYFYDRATRCNKRERGAGCDAFEGINRNHAILGASEHCIAVHPSDLAVALTALDAELHIEGAGGKRQIKVEGFHRLPGDTPDVETDLLEGELITAVAVPALPFARRSTYRKVRDRASFAFALVTVAAALELDPQNGTVRDVRLALGGVAHKPWRAFAAEGVLRGRPADAVTFRAAAEAELQGAVALKHNAFKIELAARTIVNVFEELTARDAS